MFDRLSPTEKRIADVIVVGGGVIGLTIARELTLRGVRNVIVIERSQPGAEASSAAAGILAPQVEADRNDDFFRLACASRDMYQEFAAALLEETGIDVELDTRGTFYVGFSEQDEGEFRDRFRWQKSHGLQVEFMSGDEARSLEPNISGKVTCGLRFPNDFQVENRRLIQALVRANENLGISLLTNCKVVSLAVDKDIVLGVETSRGFVAARAVVIAAGAWSSLIASVSSRLRIEPVRGQMVSFTPSTCLARHVIYSSRGYVVPRHDGRLLAGSTSERVGFDKSVTSEAVNGIKSMAEEIIPALRNLQVADSWAGFRPCAEDALPVLGPSEDVRGLFFATGHYRNGILLAPVTGKLVADSIINGHPSGFLQPFLPSRFLQKAAAV